MKNRTKRMTKKTLILVFSIALSVCFCFNTCALDMSIEEFFALPYSVRDEILNDLILEEFGENQNARYTSGDNDPTHQNVTSAGINILKNTKGFWTNNTNQIELLMTYSAAPDKLTDSSYTIGNTDHFYVVSTGNGLLGGTSAADKFVEYYNKAVTAQNANNSSTAMKHLGRALHYLQDVSVPYHTVSTVTTEHANYETYCYQCCFSFLGSLPTMTSDDYDAVMQCTLRTYLINMATLSNSYYNSVINNSNNWLSVARTLMKTSAKNTAAVLYRFSRDTGLSLN